MFFNTAYTIDGDKLLIKCSFYSVQTYRPNEKTSKSSNIISTSAASFDRIEITYGKFEKQILSLKHK
jgi:hypothetical protein